jgi:hypothetical protein
MPPDHRTGWTVRRIAAAAAIAAFLATGSASAIDATSVDIIGLRLGMQEPEIVAQLAHQGYKISHTPGAIAATTKDGQLQIALTPQRGVTEIRYVFNGYAVGESEMLHQAILTRFGNPNQATPPTWCRSVGANGICPGNQPSLRFLPDSLTLLLRSETSGGP